VISAGTSVRQSIALIRAAGAQPCGLTIALDRMERGAGERSAVQEVEAEYGLPVISIANLDDLVSYLQEDADRHVELGAVQRYRERYGAAVHA